MSSSGAGPSKRVGEGDLLDHYAVLGVSTTATGAQLKKAFRTLAVKLHPDKNTGREEWAATEFDKVRKSYDALRDPKQRAELDRALAAVQQARARFDKMDAARQRLKTDLEAQERAAAAKLEEERAFYRPPSEKAKVEALRDENERLAEEYARGLAAARAPARRRASPPASDGGAGHGASIVAVRWSPEEQGRGVGSARLRELFGQFGAVRDVTALTPRSANVQFAGTDAAKRAAARGVPGFKVSVVASNPMFSPIKQARAVKRGRDILKAEDADAAARVSAQAVAEFEAEEAAVLEAMRTFTARSSARAGGPS